MREIALCHPRMQKIAAQWITACKAEGINVAISETLRILISNGIILYALTKSGGESRA